MLKPLKKLILISSVIWISITANITQWTDWFDDVNGYWNEINNAVSWIGTIWANSVNEDNGDEILNTIKRAINRSLWMLSFVALLLCLLWWFKVLTAAGDDWKVKSWTKILKNAAIWLAIIWLARLIVSFVFRIVGKTAGGSSGWGGWWWGIPSSSTQSSSAPWSIPNES